MKSRQTIRLVVTALGILVGASSFAPAQAATISVVPGAQVVAGTGTSVSVDINVTGIGATEEVGGFSFTLTFDPTVLQADLSLGGGLGYLLDPSGKMGIGTDCSFGFSGGVLDLCYLAEDFLPAGSGAEDQAALQALQQPSGAFTLATVYFKTTVAPGYSDLKLAPIGAYLSDGLGNATLQTNANNGCVLVETAQDGTNAVCRTAPEPTTLALLGSGIVSLVAARRRQKRARA